MITLKHVFRGEDIRDKKVKGWREGQGEVKKLNSNERTVQLGEKQESFKVCHQKDR